MALQNESTSCVKLRFERSLEAFPPDMRYKLPRGYRMTCFDLSTDADSFSNTPGTNDWLEVIHDAFGDFCAHFTRETFSEKFLEKEQFDPSGLFFVLHNDICVGTVMAWRDTLNDSIGRLHYLAVRRSHRGCGLGHFLIESVAAYFAANGTSLLYLTTESFRENAIGLYQKHGFSVIND
eukprot:m.103138 g.103138  ORF g.103138 m.103138 type:complete len:179 (+) comp16839_c0_seq2:229-765(+)